VRAAAGDTLKTLGQVVEQVRAEGITGVRWTALTSEALGNLNARLSVVIGDVAANGFVKAMGERLALVAEQIGGEYRQSIFRQVLELTPGAMSGEAAAGLEALLKLPRAELSNEAALAVLNRLNPQQLRTFLEALNGLDNATIAALTRTPHLDLVAGNPQAFQIIRSYPELLQAISTVPRENADLFLQAIRTLPDRAFGSGVGAYSPNFFRNLAQSPQSMRFLIDANYDTFSALYRTSRYDFARLEENLGAIEDLMQRIPADQRAVAYQRFLDRLAREDPAALGELRNAVNTRRAAAGLPLVRSYSAAELDEIVRTTSDIREIRRLASQMDNSSAGSLFERWASRYVFDRDVGMRRTRLVVRAVDNPHLGPMWRDRISDVYYHPDGSVWDAKLYQSAGEIDVFQLDDYRKMEEAGFVITGDGQRLPVKSINYLFSDRAAAEANLSTIHVQGGAEAWFIDDSGVLQHLN
jgi:hypothetical protein